MKDIFLAIAAAAAVAAPIAAPAPAQAQIRAARGVDQLRVGPYLLTVYPGSPPTASNAKNSLSRGIRLYERPHSSTFAAVAAQEMFETEFKARGGYDKRQMELISHQIEALVASRYGGFDLAQFEAKEAYTLTLYRQFRGMSQADLLARMRSTRPIAENWLAANRRLIQQLVAYRFPR